MENKCKFISGFAANDPSSTKMVWNLIKKRYEGKSCIFLNTRNDRRYRTHQLLDLVFNRIKPAMLIVRGEKMPSQFDNYKKEFEKIEKEKGWADTLKVVINTKEFNQHYSWTVTFNSDSQEKTDRL